MITKVGQPVNYYLGHEIALHLNPLIGQQVKLQLSGDIECIHCHKSTKKSYSQGYCFICSQRLAACDLCIVRPEKCHYDQGTCREPEWGEAHCMQPHVVYLANASGLKVGITREVNIPTRWIDQGAAGAIPLLRVASRQLAGFVEVIIKNHLADKTNWREMLKGDVADQDFNAARDRVFAQCWPEIANLQATYGMLAINPILQAAEVHFAYPVSRYPEKIKSVNLDKTGEISGELLGCKGQYLIFDSGVVNLRKYTGYLGSIHA